MKASKKYNNSLKMVEEDRAYSIKEAVGILKNMPKAKFDETVEFAAKLDVDAKQTEQMVRGSVVLPNGIGKVVRVLVFCEPEKESEATEAGADYIGTQETVDKIMNGWFEFDCCISTPGMMRIVSKVGRVLGPRGLMPSPKTDTVTENVGYAVKEAKRGKIDFRMDKTGCVHVGIGKISFTEDALSENVQSFVDALVAARPSSTKGEYLKNYFLSTTMSPSVKVRL
ncbi:MAG: 50S ribosomal protein L1 [Candidatus Omnitrophica bacterium]|nr:50S ribosomal protein L1 [Candidatus Omnitrophota bacterium]MDD5080725.1 50S ribosomal protein L1 [Candidatus Omnitrophota bacterium]MDD5440689.1 50S ribosomal protein L1 [Candidatus Omnitrophota bacterium]